MADTVGGKRRTLKQKAITAYVKASKDFMAAQRACELALRARVKAKKRLDKYIPPAEGRSDG